MLEAAPQGSNSNERYFTAFDGVRAIAIGMVFICHYLGWNYGTYGVNIFLVLSGFLITGVLYDSRNASHRFRNFYLRRTLRIFPVYYGFWFLMLLLTPVLGIVWSKANWLYIVYLGNYIHALFGSQIPNHPELLDILTTHVPYLHLKETHRFPISIGHFWSLCVEEQFYLVWPLVVYRIKNRRKLIRICLALIAIIPLARLMAVIALPANPLAVWTFTWLRCDEFLIGGAAALLVRSSYAARLVHQGKLFFLFGLAASVIGECSRPYWNPELWIRFQMTFQFAAIDAAALGLLLIGMRDTNVITRTLSWSPLRALGRISYGFYIFHDLPHVFYLQATIRWMTNHPHRFYSVITPEIVTAMIAFIGTLAIAVLSYNFLELPFLKLKNRWAPNRPQHLPRPVVPA